MSNVVLLNKINCPTCTSEDLMIKPNLSKNRGLDLEKIDYLCICNTCECLWGMSNDKRLPEQLENLEVDIKK